MDAGSLGDRFENVRPELTAYLTRLVVRPQVAEELVQTAFLRALEAIERAPRLEGEFRPWIFRIATNLAIDESRRHRRWREVSLPEWKDRAQQDPSFMAATREMAGTPETKAIAREHLAVCFSCTMGNLPEEKAAALLLVEVQGFSIGECAAVLDARPAQVKNWLQEARRTMQERYAASCALIAKQGVCYQCVELDERVRANAGNPLAGAPEDLRGRLDILRDQRHHPVGAWHRMMFDWMRSSEEAATKSRRRR